METGDDDKTVDFSVLSVEQLVNAHNELVAECKKVGLMYDNVTEFESREDGVEACEKLQLELEAHAKSNVPEGAATQPKPKRVRKPPSKKKEQKKVKITKPKAKTETKKSKKVKKPKAKVKRASLHMAKAKNGNGAGPRKGSKTELIAKLLRRKRGATSADILDATGWKGCSIIAMAKAAGVKLRIEKKPGKREVRYFGT